MAEEGRNAENQAINICGDRPGNILSKQRNTLFRAVARQAERRILTLLLFPHLLLRHSARDTQLPVFFSRETINNAARDTLYNYGAGYVSKCPRGSGLVSNNRARSWIDAFLIDNQIVPVIVLNNSAELSLLHSLTNRFLIE